MLPALLGVSASGRLSSLGTAGVQATADVWTACLLGRVDAAAACTCQSSCRQLLLQLQALLDLGHQLAGKRAHAKPAQRADRAGRGRRWAAGAAVSSSASLPQQCYRLGASCSTSATSAAGVAAQCFKCCAELPAAPTCRTQCRPCAQGTWLQRKGREQCKSSEWRAGMSSKKWRPRGTRQRGNRWLHRLTAQHASVAAAPADSMLHSAVAQHAASSCHPSPPTLTKVPANGPGVSRGHLRVHRRMAQLE